MEEKVKALIQDYADNQEDRVITLVQEDFVMNICDALGKVFQERGWK